MRRIAFFAFWILFFVAAHLWSFQTAPWNGGGIFEDCVRSVTYLKTRGIGHPFAAAWWFWGDNWCVESLFSYYLWPWFSLFGYSIVVDEMASLTMWSVTFLFTLLLIDLLLESYVVTSVVALVFTFLPFAFIYSFVAFHYGMTPMFAVMSLYFLHKGGDATCQRDTDQRRDSVSMAALTVRPLGAATFFLAVGGIAAGLCLWSSVLGQQYVAALALCAPFYAKQWRKGLIVVAGFAVSAAPIVSYMAFHWTDYTYHQSTRWNPTLDLKPLWDTFFTIPSHSYFLLDTLLIPLPYYALLLPGIAVAIWRKSGSGRIIVLLALLPVAGVFVTGGPYVEHRLMMAIPFWVLLIGFGFNIFRQMRAPLILPVVIVAMGLVPSVRYIYAKSKDPTSIFAFTRRTTF